MLVLLKKHLNHLKYNIFEYFYFFKKQLIFFITYNDENQRPEEENLIKDIRNLFRLKKN